jgi:hypothetical protein
MVFVRGGRTTEGEVDYPPMSIEEIKADVGKRVKTGGFQAIGLLQYNCPR